MQRLPDLVPRRVAARSGRAAARRSPFTAAHEADCGRRATRASRRTLVDEGLLRPMRARGVRRDPGARLAATPRRAAGSWWYPTTRGGRPDRGVDPRRRCAAPQRDPRDAVLGPLQPQRAAGCDAPACAAASGDLTAADIEAPAACAVTTALRTPATWAGCCGGTTRSRRSTGSCALGVAPGVAGRRGRAASRGTAVCVQLRRWLPLGDPGAESPPESALRLHWHEADLPAGPTTQIWVHAR